LKVQVNSNKHFPKTVIKEEQLDIFFNIICISVKKNGYFVISVNIFLNLIQQRLVEE